MTDKLPRASGIRVILSLLHSNKSFTLKELEYEACKQISCRQFWYALKLLRNLHLFPSVRHAYNQPVRLNVL